jgi:hypothetical protein
LYCTNSAGTRVTGVYREDTDAKPTIDLKSHHGRFLRLVHWINFKLQTINVMDDHLLAGRHVRGRYGIPNLAVDEDFA